MRYMLIVKATKYSEAGVRPSDELIASMSAFNEALASAGKLLAAEGLQPSASGLRISYAENGGLPQVLAGPFEDPRELIAGFTLIDVESEEEAIRWALRMPNPSVSGEGEIELRLLCEEVSLLNSSTGLALETDLRDQLGMLKRR
ncbi:YciI family protein [Paenibacillus sp. 2TAB23]|uniref:YciI family protein n=1 Tax=Paenibacillus sp. 2TAB23 TaxID=3233004 RepID=UPI003F96D9AA